jgi:UDP-glucose 4-epimerase
MCERILMDEVVANKELRVVALRYFNPIGAHPSTLIGELPIGVPSNLVPYITQTAIGKRKELTVFGNDYDTPDGSCLRDYIHVVDLAKAHVRALQRIASLPNRFEPINLGSGNAVSVLELIRSFMRVTGEKVNYTIGPRRPGDVVKVYADPRKSNQLLHWQTEYNESDALLHAWNWEKRLKA